MNPNPAAGMGQPTDPVVRLQARIQALTRELEVERMRLAACGVVAMANTPESAAKAREMLPEYRSASCDDVANVVDSEMRYRAALEELACLGNGDAWGNSIGNCIAQKALGRGYQ